VRHPQPAQALARDRGHDQLTGTNHQAPPPAPPPTSGPSIHIAATASSPAIPAATCNTTAQQAVVGQESRLGQEGRSEFDIDPDELVCEGARRVLAVALEEEVAAHIAAHTGGRAVSGSGSGR
jgi:hypothetical protein